MPKVICTRENASELINGVKFTHVPDVGMVSDEISAAVAAQFQDFPGYEIVEEDDEPQVKPPEATKKPPVKARAAAPAPTQAPETEPVAQGADAKPEETF